MYEETRDTDVHTLYYLDADLPTWDLSEALHYTHTFATNIRPLRGRFLRLKCEYLE